ncbi:MAG: hypothetical protein VCB26_13540, partial [Candidatus Hydrogenedentota bacterium]
ANIRSVCEVDFDDMTTPEQLYDLDQDLRETTNVLNTYPEIAANLNEMLQFISEGRVTSVD